MSALPNEELEPIHPPFGPALPVVHELCGHYCLQSHLQFTEGSLPVLATTIAAAIEQLAGQELLFRLSC